MFIISIITACNHIAKIRTYTNKLMFQIHFQQALGVQQHVMVHVSLKLIQANYFIINIFNACLIPRFTLLFNLSSF